MFSHRHHLGFFTRRPAPQVPHFFPTPPLQQGLVPPGRLCGPHPSPEILGGPPPLWSGFGAPNQVPGGWKNNGTIPGPRGIYPWPLCNPFRATGAGSPIPDSPHEAPFGTRMGRIRKGHQLSQAQSWFPQHNRPVDSWYENRPYLHVRRVTK